MRFDEERGSTLCFNDDAHDTALPAQFLNNSNIIRCPFANQRQWSRP